MRERERIYKAFYVNRVYSVNLSLPLVVLPRLQRSLESCDLLEGILSESRKCTNDDINKRLALLSSVKHNVNEATLQRFPHSLLCDNKLADIA